MRYLRVTLILVAAGMACSRGPERSVVASPTAPSATGATSAIAFVGGVSGPMDVMFPPRNEPLLFRNELETKYQTGLNRPPSTTYVDREGEVVWTQEYIRYRANGCDHGTGNDRVMRQIDGAAPSGICNAPSDFFAIELPTRAEVFEFRRALEIKYQQMGRGLTTTYVDMEGSVIWTQEYLRYRINSCDHTTSGQKVFAQIDGGPVQPTCFVPCSYVLLPDRIDISSSAMSGSFEMRSNPVGCPWTAVSDASWLTIPSEFQSGNSFTVIPYSVAANTGTDRTGRIQLTYATGSLTFTVNQAGTPFGAAFTMIDPFRSTNPTTECWIRTASTPCNFTGAANLPGGTYTFAWSASYNYAGTTRTFTQVGSSNTFSFSDACGLAGSAAGGNVVALEVTMTITDNLGNSVTIQAGNQQPPLTLKLFTCG